MSRLVQRRIDRIRKIIDILEDREKSLLGVARDTIKDRLQELKDRLANMLNLGKKDKDDEDVIAEDKDDDDEKKEGFVGRRIASLRKMIENIEKGLKLDTLSDRSKTLLNTRIDLLRTAIDRLLKREKKDI